MTLATFTLVAACGCGGGERRRAGVPQDDRGVVLEHRVGDADVADVAAGAGERHPRRRRVAGRARAAERRRVVVDHVVVRVGRRRRRVVRRVAPVREIGPVLERGREADARRRREVAVRVRDRLAVPVGIEPGERGQDPAARVGDQDGVVVGVERAVVRRGSRAGAASARGPTGRSGCPGEVHVVELEVDDVLDLPVLRRGCRSVAASAASLAILADASCVRPVPRSQRRVSPPMTRFLRGITLPSGRLSDSRYPPAPRSNTLRTGRGERRVTGALRRRRTKPMRSYIARERRRRRLARLLGARPRAAATARPGRCAARGSAPGSARAARSPLRRRRS